MLYERVHALFVSWADDVASSLILLLLVVIAGAIYFLGLPLLIIAVGLYVLRPPK